MKLHPALKIILKAEKTELVDIEYAKKTYLKSRKEYYNEGSSVLTDFEYDLLQDFLEAVVPTWRELSKTGAKVGSKSDVRLRVPMPSLSKIKIESTKALLQFLDDLTECDRLTHASAKIDGSAVEVVYEKGTLTRLATRGDGEVGKDISHFIPYVSHKKWERGGRGLPLKVNTKEPLLVLRMEATIQKSIHKERYQEEYASDRAMASAVFNRHDASDALSDIDFVLLGVSSPQMSVSWVPNLVEANGFIRPLSKTFKGKPTTDDLRELLDSFQESSPYSLDGLVVGPYSYIEGITNKVPKFTRSVKIDDHENAPTTKIKQIIWETSAFGLLVPKAVLEPIRFGNVVVKFAALHNPRWAMDRGAGVGAVVKVIRSGEIIPKIVEVVKPARFDLPDQSEFGEYEFDGVRLKLCEDTEEVHVQRMNRMFKKLGLENIGTSFAQKLVDYGYESTSDLLLVSLDVVRSLEGVKSSADKLFKEMKRIRSGEFTLPQLMDASGELDSGLGLTLLTKLATDHPEAFKSVSTLKAFAKKNLNTKVIENSIGPARAAIFKNGVFSFIEWVSTPETMNRLYPAESDYDAVKVKPFGVEVKKSGSLSGKGFSWTGYRSEEEENFVKALGGDVVSFGTKTTVLFFKPGGKASSKVEKAGNRAMTFQEWKELYDTV